jgi:hypothetical protein
MRGGLLLVAAALAIPSNLASVSSWTIRTQVPPAARTLGLTAVCEARPRTQRKITKLPQTHSLKQIIGIVSFRVIPGEACL